MPFFFSHYRSARVQREEGKVDSGSLLLLDLAYCRGRWERSRRKIRFKPIESSILSAVVPSCFSGLLIPAMRKVTRADPWLGLGADGEGSDDKDQSTEKIAAGDGAKWYFAVPGANWSRNRFSIQTDGCRTCLFLPLWVVDCWLLLGDREVMTMKQGFMFSFFFCTLLELRQRKEATTAKVQLLMNRGNLQV